MVIPMVNDRCTPIPRVRQLRSGLNAHERVKSGAFLLLFTFDTTAPVEYTADDSWRAGRSALATHAAMTPIRLIGAAHRPSGSTLRL